jgi:UDP-GlcNAc:undecaprenyl-phosphate/decaprenyl-phosphate GlcNAc-1-phosphate transferase
MLLALRIPIPSPHLCAVFAASVVLCTLLTWLLLRYVKKLGVDQPDGGRKSHSRAILRLGGLPIFITLVVGFIYTPFGVRHGEPFIDNWWPIILALFIIFSIGLADDIKPLGARVKLMGQLSAAGILFGAGYSIDVLTHPTQGTQFALGWLALPVTVFWLVAIPNIINLIDGMDGLAGGFGLFLCITLGVVGHFAGMPDVVILSAVMAGAILGFLFFNFPPAKIFLGDGGAYLIGFFIAALSLASSQKGTIIAALLVIIVALGVPILDTSFAILRRAIRGVPLFKADAEHIHHRLILLGYTKEQALLVLYIACAVLSAAGITILLTRGLTAVIATAALAVFGLLAARYLGYVRSWSALRAQVRQAMANRRELEYVRAHSHLLGIEALRVGSEEEFVPLLHQAITRCGFRLDDPSAGRFVAVPVGPMQVWQAGLKDRHADRNLAHRHLEVLAESLELALERWPVLPGIHLVMRDGMSEPLNATPAPVTEASSPTIHAKT